MVSTAPVVGPTYPEYAVELRQIKRLLRSMPDDEVAIFQDESDVDLNPRGPLVARRHTDRPDVNDQRTGGRSHHTGEQPKVPCVRIAGVVHGNTVGESARCRPQRRSVCVSLGRSAEVSPLLEAD